MIHRPHLILILVIHSIPHHFPLIIPSFIPRLPLGATSLMILHHSSLPNSRNSSSKFQSHVLQLTANSYPLPSYPKSHRRGLALRYHMSHSYPSMRKRTKIINEPRNGKRGNMFTWYYHPKNSPIPAACITSDDVPVSVPCTVPYLYFECSTRAK